MGQQFDFLISEDSLKNTNGFEYGTSEVDKNYGLNGNKMIKERGDRLPKALKDMSDLLKKKREDCSHLYTVGVLHSDK